jgi:hypothetical protein
MRESQFDELCGLRQIAVSWAIFRLYRKAFLSIELRHSISRHSYQLCPLVLGKLIVAYVVNISYSPPENPKSSLYRVIQRESSVFWEVIVSVIVRRKVRMNICLILICDRDRAVWISRPNSVRFLFVGLDEHRSFKLKLGRIALWHFGCCCPNTETWRST